jgi:hypothetical protein
MHESAVTRFYPAFPVVDGSEFIRLAVAVSSGFIFDRAGLALKKSTISADDLFFSVAGYFFRGAIK